MNDRLYEAALDVIEAHYGAWVIDEDREWTREMVEAITSEPTPASDHLNQLREEVAERYKQLEFS